MKLKPESGANRIKSADDAYSFTMHMRLRVSDIREDTDAGTPLMYVIADRKVGRSVKTQTSERVVPIHPELRRLGFLDYVAERRREDHKAWLFPLIAPDKRGGLKAWNKW